MPNPDGTPTLDELEEIKRRVVAGTMGTPVPTPAPPPTGGVAGLRAAMSPAPSTEVTFEPEKVGKEALDPSIEAELKSRKDTAVKAVQSPTLSYDKRKKLAARYDLPTPSKPTPTKAERPASSLQMLRSQVADTAQERDRALDLKESAAAQQIEADRKLADSTLALREQQSQATALLEKQRQDNEQRRLDTEARYQKQLDDEINKPINEEVDPDRWRKSRTGGQTALNIIGLILSGIGSGLAKQENAALAVINRNIDRDIDAQKEKIANAKSERQQRMASKFSMLGQMRAKFGDERTAELVTRDRLLHSHQDELEKLAEKHKQDAIGARAAEAAAQIAAQRGEVQQQLRQGNIQVRSTEEQRAAAAANARAVAAERQRLEGLGAVTDRSGKVIGYRDPQTGAIIDKPITSEDVAKLGIEAGKAAHQPGAPQNSAAARDLQANYNALGGFEDGLKSDMAKGGKPWTPEGQGIVSKVGQKVSDTLGGEGTYRLGTSSVLPDADLSPDEQARASRFNNARQALLSMGTQLTGAGAPSEGEALRSAAGSAQSEQDLITLIQQYRPILAKKLEAYGVQAGPPPQPAVVGAVGAGQ